MRSAGPTCTRAVTRGPPRGFHRPAVAPPQYAKSRGFPRLLASSKLERAKGFEPSTPTLARLCSTTELHPHPKPAVASRPPSKSYATRDAGSAMAATPDQLFRFLDRLGIAHATVSHPALFTVEQSQALRGKVPG